MAQMAGIALGVSAAALWALEVPGLAYRDPARPQVKGEPIAQPSETQEARFDRERTSDIAYRLDLGVKKAPAPATKVERPVQPEPPPVEPIHAGPTVVYIGPIFEGSRSLAVVSVDGRQRIVPEGRSIGSARIVSIAENQIELQDEQGGRRTVVRGERTGSAVSWLRNMPGAVPVAAVANGQNARRGGVAMPGGRAQASGFSPEMEQRFRERGIDPAQAQRWREAMRERQNQNPSQNSAQVQRAAMSALDIDATGQDASRGVIAVPKEDADGVWTETVAEENGEEIIYRIKRMTEDGKKIDDDGEIRP
jgi:hypothetical protein